MTITNCKMLPSLIAKHLGCTDHSCPLHDLWKGKRKNARTNSKHTLFDELTSVALGESSFTFFTISSLAKLPDKYPQLTTLCTCIIHNCVKYNKHMCRHTHACTKTAKLASGDVAASSVERVVVFQSLTQTCCKRMQTHMSTDTCKHTHTHSLTYTQSHPHTHIYIYVHVYTLSTSSSVLWAFPLVLLSKSNNKAALHPLSNFVIVVTAPKTSQI